MNDEGGILSVLVVDDDQERAKALARDLARRNYSTAHCISGEAAVELLGRFVPNVVVTAFRLGAVDGVEVCRAAVAMPRPAVVIMLGEAFDVREVERALRAGACDFISASAMINELVTRIEVQARVRRLRGAAPLGPSELPTPAEGIILQRVRPPSGGLFRARVVIRQADEIMRQALVKTLRLRGFAATAMRSAVGASVATLTRSRDAAVVDVGDPATEGVSFCTTLRQSGFEGKIVATAGSTTGALRDRAVSAGADELVPLLKVVPYLESEFPPVSSRAGPSSIASGPLVNHADIRAVLTRTEWRLFQAFVDAKGDCVAEDELKARGRVATKAALVQHIRRMRPKLAVFGLDLTPKSKFGYRCVRVPS